MEQRGQLTQAQILRLVTAIEPSHVEQKRGMSYMAQHEVRAELTRIFGYGNWDTQVELMELIYERHIQRGDEQYPTNGKAPSYWVTCYQAAVRLNIRDYQGNPVCSFVEHHAEENAPLPNRGEAHAMAITSVESYALRRAAIGLGDRLGLGLYNKGSIAPLVQRTLQLDDPESPQRFEPKPPPQVGTAGVSTRSISQSPKMQKFEQAREQIQERRDQARERTALERAQDGMKVDS